MKSNARLFLGSINSLRFFSEDVVRLVEYGVQLTRPELIGISKDGSISLHVHSIHIVKLGQYKAPAYQAQVF